MLQKIMIENQSKVSEIKEKVERAIEKAGFNVTVNWNGTLSYNDEHSYSHQQEVHEAFAEILDEYKD